jgi:O-antigen/teichoic acid export membrane protein
MLAQMITVAGGTAASQAITLGGIVIAANLLSPIDFGIFGLQLAISTPVAILATGRFESAYIRASRSSRIINLLALTTGLTMAVALGTTLLLAGVALYLNMLSLFDAVLIGALVFAQASAASLTEINNHNASYSTIAISRISAAVVTQVFVITWAFLDPGRYVLGVGTVFGLAASATVSLVGNREWLVNSRRHVSVPRMHAVAKRYKSYLFFNGPQAVVSGLQESLAMATISSFFGAAALGNYVLLGRILRGPIAIVAESVGRVLQRQIVDLELSNRSRFLARAIAFIIAVGVLFTLASATIAPWILDFFFGEKWPLLASLCSASALYFGAYLVGGSVAPIPWATGDYRPIAPIAIAGSLAYPALMLGAAWLEFSFTATVLIASIGMAAYFAVYVCAVYYFCTRGGR